MYLFARVVPVVSDAYHWKDQHNYKATHWYTFQEAVKEHQAEAQIVLQPIFSQMGLENW